MNIFKKIIKKKFGFTYPCPRKLREIMQMSLIERESPEKIKTIWESYHEDRQDNVSMVN